MPWRRFTLHCLLVVVDVLTAGAAVEWLSRHDLESGRQVRARPSDARGPEVLFLGDSHFFGLWVDSANTMPSLAAAFSRECDKDGFVAINQSRGGATTWLLLDDVRQRLTHVKPKALVARAGVANRLSLDPRRANLWQRLYVVSLARRAARDLSYWVSGKPPVNPFQDFGLGIAREELDANNSLTNPWDQISFHGLPSAENQDYARDVAPGVRQDLTTLGELAKARGIPAFFVSYLVPGAVFSQISDDIGAAAAASGATFVDLRPVAKRALLEARRADILLHDGHPTRLGYAIEARELLQAMTRSGVLTGPPLDDTHDWLLRQALEPTPAPLRANASVERIPTDKSLTFVVRGRPGGRGTFILGEWGFGLPFSTEMIDFNETDVMECIRTPQFQFILDATGEARIPVPDGFLTRLPAGSVATAIVYGTEMPTPSVARAPYIDLFTGQPREFPGSRPGPR